jgi:histidine triad (HIT) family protein
MADTLFTKIIRGEIPSHKLYEDEYVFSFLDISPLSPGHALVIPKKAVVTLGELDDESAAAIGRVLPRLCRALARVTGVQDYNVLQNNGRLAHQAVMHVHFHIIPKPDDERGLGIEWPASKLSPEEGARLAEAVNRELAGEVAPGDPAR